jgi:hypothetical protein
MQAVKAFFIKNKKHNNNAGSDADSQSKNINGGKSFVFPQVSEGDLEIILKHNCKL